MGWSVPSCHTSAPPARRRHQLVAEAELVAAARRPRHPGQERVGALVDGGQAGERRRRDLAAEALGGLEHGDLGRRLPGELERRGQPGDAAADDDDVAHVAPRPGRRRVDDPVGQGADHRRVVVDARGAGEGQPRARRRGRRASMSRSYSTSRWSATNPHGHTSRPAPRSAAARSSITVQDVGPEPRLGRAAGRLPATPSRSTAPGRRARATAAAVARSSSG